MELASSSLPQTEALPGKLAAKWPALASVALGLVFVFGVGFSHVSAVHNAAHDARHAAGFPCH